MLLQKRAPGRGNSKCEASGRSLRSWTMSSLCPGAKAGGGTVGLTVSILWLLGETWRGCSEGGLP